MKRSVFTIAILAIFSHAHAQDVPFDERTDDYYKSRNAAQFESILSDWGVPFDDLTSAAEAAYFYPSSPCGRQLNMVSKINIDFGEKWHFNYPEKDKAENDSKIHKIVSDIVKSGICTKEGLTRYARYHRPVTDDELDYVNESFGTKWRRSVEGLAAIRKHHKN